MKEFNKLVRDKIPEIIENDGKICNIDFLSDEDYLILLDEKLDAVNAVNITDGIDGLASSISAVVAAFFLVVAAVFGGRQVGICGAVLLGGTIGFLVMNHHPAKAFMGDTGSLFLGGFIIGVGFMINQPVVLLIAGLVFVFEMITSFIQIIAIRCFDKHVFKKAPFHHHLEQCNWNEIKIVAVFSAVTVVCCVVAFFGLNGNLIR